MRRAREAGAAQPDDDAPSTSSDAPLEVYIAHDNVPLGEAMARLGTKGDVLIETKRSATSLCFVYGRVKFSGDAHRAPGVGGAVSAGARGSQCLVLEKCHARAAPPPSETQRGPFGPMLAALDCGRRLFVLT